MLTIAAPAAQAILRASLQTNGLHKAFDHVLSTDKISSFKPDPKAYQLAVNSTGYRREEILLVASAGWDAAGARWFAYPPLWNNRLSVPLEELEVAPDVSGSSLQDLTSLLHLDSQQ